MGQVTSTTYVWPQALDVFGDRNDYETKFTRSFTCLQRIGGFCGYTCRCRHAN